MQPEIKERPAFSVLGIQVRVNPMQADYNDIWHNQFGPREADVKPFSTDGAYYAAYFCRGEGNLMDLLVGMAAAEVQAVPDGLTLRVVPAATEAVVTCDLKSIGATWQAIYGEWLPTSGYERDDASADYEYFPPDFRPEGGVLTIHVPIRKKA